MSTLDIRRPSPHVAEVWLNRPDLRNAFNSEVITDLTSAFQSLGSEAPSARWAPMRSCAPSCWAATARPSAPAAT